MSSWLEPIRRILEADTGNLRELAELVGGDPKIFYVGRDLSKCDLRGQDLRGMDLTGALINPDYMDEQTFLDPQFDPRFKVRGHYIQIGMREEVLALVYAFADDVRYVYKAWALKALLELGIKHISDKQVQHAIESNDKLHELYEGKAGRMRRLTVMVYPYIQEEVHKLSIAEGRVANRDSYNQIVIAALVYQYLVRSRAKNYSTIEPLDMFEGAHGYLKDIKRGKRFIS